MKKGFTSAGMSVQNSFCAKGSLGKRFASPESKRKRAEAIRLAAAKRRASNRERRADRQLGAGSALRGELAA